MKTALIAVQVFVILFLSRQHHCRRVSSVVRHPNSLRALNTRPVIGILSQEAWGPLAEASPQSVSYIAASYIKWIESAGARVVPIRLNQSDEYYNELFNSINGLLFPGGGSSLDASGYAKTGSLLYDLAIKANKNGDYFPVWGTCLGFELLLYLSAGKKNYLTSCSSYDRALNITFLEDARTSRLYGRAPKDVLRTLTSEKSTSNFHHWCMTQQNLTSSYLGKFYKPLATSLDDNSLTFITTIEAIDYPIWGLQFHPEKSAYEWGSKYASVPHSPSSVRAAQYFADFFVNQARRNQHRFDSPQQEDAHLIYNYHPIYTGNVSNSFTQSYFFD